MIELRDARLVPAKIVDESALGLALHVLENDCLRPAQTVAVRRRGFRLAAVIRYVKSEAARTRVGLKLYPDRRSGRSRFRFCIFGYLWLSPLLARSLCGDPLPL